MKRTDFIRRMVGRGYPLKEAVALASRAARFGLSYADRWAYEKSLPRGAATGLTKLFGGARICHL